MIRHIYFKSLTIIITIGVIATFISGCQNNAASDTENITAPVQSIDVDLSVKTTTENSEDDFMHYHATYDQVSMSGHPLIQDVINTEIKRRISRYQNEMLMRMYMQSQSISNSENMTSEKETLSINGQTVYQDHQIFSISFDESPESFIYRNGKYLNFDLVTGNIIPLNSLMTSSELKEVIDAATGDFISGGNDAFDVKDSAWDTSYYFIDDKTLCIVIAPYQLNYQVNEPIMITQSIAPYTTPQNMQPIDLSYDVATRKEINNAFLLYYNYPVFLSSDNYLDKINADIKTNIDKAMNYNVDLAIDDHMTEDAISTALRPYFYSADFKIYSNTLNVLSIGLNYYQYTGGAHGLMHAMLYNYCLNDGKRLTLKDLFPESFDYITYINDHIHTAIKTNDPSNTLYHFDSINDDTKFYIKDDMLVIYFDVYEIAPYAAGIQTFAIPLID